MIKKIINSKVFTVAAGLLLFLVLISAFGVKKALNGLDKEVANQQEKIDEVNRSMANLEKSKDLLNNQNYLERQIKLKLNYKKPDENVIFIYRTDDSRKNAQNQEQQEPGQQSFWQKWLDFLTGK